MTRLLVLCVFLFSCPPALGCDERTKDQPGEADSKGQDNTQRTMRIHVVGPDLKYVMGARIHTAIWTKSSKINRDYVSDARGDVVIQLPPDITILRVWARSDGRVPLFANWDARDGHKAPQQFTFRLRSGTAISGVVKNEDGQPVEGVRVEVRRVRARGEQLNERPVLGTWLAYGDAGRVTDTQGRWSLDNVPAGDDVQVLVKLSHPEYVDDVSWGGLQREQNVTTKSLRIGRSTIVMRRGVTVVGRVTDPHGEPVSGAIVVWGDDPYSEVGSQEVSTDAKGVYRFPPLLPGPKTVTVVAEGWAPNLKKIEIAPITGALNFQLEPGRAIHIRFVDGAGNPVPEVNVGIDSWRAGKSLYNHKHPNVLDTKIPRQANEQGAYEWSWAPEDPVTYTFYKEGYRFVPNRPLVAGAEHKIVLTK